MIIHESETIRKILIQWILMFGLINKKISHINNYYSYVYKKINLYLDGKCKKKECLEIISYFNSFLNETVITPFDNDGLIIEISAIISKINTYISSLPEILNPLKKMFAALRDEEFHSKEATFPAGCDLMATTLSQCKTPSLYYQARKGDDIDHHFATIILEDGLDFVVMEGFARGRQGFDRNWEFIMHGVSSDDKHNSFKKYNDELFSSYLGVKVEESFSTDTPSRNLHLVKGLHTPEKDSIVL